ncbi:helix-turn-helix transcriptional regulator [Acinetobacter soli]|uniref:helix-turn-helix transcriptional regulator n=1 Tax=Acinetobacter soli TaxID=487316 RepID=UPI003C7CC826
MMRTPLRKIREEKKYSLAEVANSVGSDAGNLSRIEKGTQKPSLHLAENLTRFFNFEISEMELLYPERYALEGEFEDLTETVEGGTNANTT